MRCSAGQLSLGGVAALTARRGLQAAARSRRRRASRGAAGRPARRRPSAFAATPRALPPRSSRLRPVAPGRRRAAPGGAWRRRSVRSEKSMPASASSSRTTPSPPGWRPRASGAAPQRVLGRPQRELLLERLDRRVERVAHRHVHGRGAGRVGAGALPAGDRLVVGELLVAEREVVHRPLPQAGTSIASPNARMTTSAIRLDVSTLPPATAAGGEGVDQAPGRSADASPGGGRRPRVGCPDRSAPAATKYDRGLRHRKRAVEVAVVWARCRRSRPRTRHPDA